VCNFSPSSHKISCRAEEEERVTKITKGVEVSPYKKRLSRQELLSLEEINIKELIKS